MTYKTSVRTIYGSLAANALRFGDPLRILPNSTLNQKWGIQDGALPYAGEYVRSRYYGIGLKGGIYELVDGLYKFKFRDYQPSQASLYEHIPLIMRRVQDGLDPALLAKYRGLRIIEKNGTFYYALMLGMLPNNGLAADAEERYTINGIVQADPWEPSLSDLNPNPTMLIPNQQVTGDRRFLASSKKFDVVFDPEAIQEILAVVNILYGDPDFAEISEFGIFQGVDRQITGDFNGVTRQYTESIYTQVADFLRVRFSAPDSLAGKTLHLDAGSSDPLGLRNI